MRTRDVSYGLFLAAAGCSGSSGDPDLGQTTDAPTYYEDVAPILQEHCVSCHSEGNIAPFSLQTYETAKAVAGPMKSATKNRTMPPWHVDASGACNSWRDARLLDEVDIATIAAWVDAGQPMGDAAHAPAPFVQPAGLEHVSATVEPAVDYTPNADLDDDYRCFLVDSATTVDRFLTGYKVHPGQPSEVHHVVVWGLDTPADEAAALALDDAEPGPGYTCFGGPGAGAARTLIGWAPGSGPTHYPDGTGLRIVGGRKLVMQVHYNLSAGTSPDRTRIDLALSDTIAKEATITGVGDFDLNLPPGLPHVEEAQTTAFAALLAPVLVHGVFPHMHKMGRTLRVDLEQAGDSTCVVDVPDYSFAWQQFYFYDKPLVIAPGEAGATLIRCGYDTTLAKTTTHFGEGTGDEMCLGGFYVTY